MRTSALTPALFGVLGIVAAVVLVAFSVGEKCPDGALGELVCIATRVLLFLAGLGALAFSAWMFWSARDAAGPYDN